MKCKVQSVKCKTKFKILKLFTFTLLLCALTFTLFASPVHAVCHSGTNINIGDCFGFGDIRSLGEATSRLVVPAFEITAAIVVIYFLIGAFFYLKSGGNKEEVERARNMMNHAIIGFIILMFAFFILQFLPQFFNLPGLDIFK